MKITKTKFKGLLVYNKQSYNDRRGFFRELYLQKHFKTKFPFDAMSFSKQNVLRGLHLQLKNPQAKLIPPHEISKDDQYIESFRWRESEKPTIQDVVYYLRKKIYLRNDK